MNVLERFEEMFGPVKFVGKDDYAGSSWVFPDVHSKYEYSNRTMVRLWKDAMWVTRDKEQLDIMYYGESRLGSSLILYIL